MYLDAVSLSYATHSESHLLQSRLWMRHNLINDDEQQTFQNHKHAESGHVTLLCTVI